MVFISLEDFVGASTTVGANCSMKRAVQTELRKLATTRVVVTPGSAAKYQNTPVARAGLFHLTSTSSSMLYFVLYVSDSVMRHKWVLSKTSAAYAQLRKSVRRVGSGCRDPTCCGQLHRLIKTSPTINTRRMWGSSSVGTRYDQCSALQTFVNDLVQVALSRETPCESMQRVQLLVEDFLDITRQRANAIDRVLYNEDPAGSPLATPSQLCQAGQDCGDTSDDSSECPICCGDLADDQTLRLPCGHNSHAGCVRVWLDFQHMCPVCRLPLDKGIVA